MVSINYNLGGQYAMDGLNQSHDMMQISLERLSTGVRINRAEDDAAGLIVRDRFQAQVNGFTEGIRNIQTAQGMIQVAEQGLNSITSALQQMRSLAVRASDDNLTNSDRQNIQKQVQGLLGEINDRANKTTYNGKHLLDGSITAATSERQGSSQIQTNSFLANGNQLVSGTGVVGNGGTTYGAVSQGSYEVKLVFDASKRDHPVETQNVTIAGTDSAGNAYLNENGGTGSTFTSSQTFYDSQGNAHAVNIQFTRTATPDQWTYHITSGSGGTWQSPVDGSGTVTFSSNGQFQTLAATASPSTQSVSGSNLTLNIADGSALGQNVVIGFGKLRENDMSTSVSNPNMTAVNGVAGTETNAIKISQGSELNANDAVGTISNSDLVAIADRTGVEHQIGMQLQKTQDQTGSSNLADTYTLTLTGLTPPTGALNGSNTNTTNVQVTFDTSGNVTSINGQAGQSFTFNLGDGTSGGQNVTLDLSNLKNVAGGTDVIAETSNGSTETNAMSANAGSTIDGAAASGALTGLPIRRYDGTLVTPIPFFSDELFYTKGAANGFGGNDYTFSMVGQSGYGGPSNSVTVSYDGTGHVAAINGITGDTTGFFTLPDSSPKGNQTISLDLANLTIGGADSASFTANGSTLGSPTTSILLGAGTNLVSGAGPTTLALNNIVNRNGTLSVSGASVTLTQVGDTNSWNYTVNAPTKDGFTGGVTGGTGTISFNEDGTLIGPSSFTATLADGTAEGQQLSFNIAGITMGRAANLGGTTSDGSAGTGGLAVNAEIFFSGSGANNSTQPITTVSDVSAGAKAVSLGGISFSMNQVSSLDVGLTSYVKAYTYVSATTVDNSLQFQVGPDEGQTQNVGIAKMDVQTLFRGQDQTGGEYGFASVDLGSSLKAQDLIGQVDDAINFVSGQNLNVGQFANNLSRTLDLQRQNQTSISGALSNLNDADMAVEATNQSKRMVLVQSGTAMVAQANTTSQFLLQLLR